ncbi:S-methyl-5'-thioadenosine phosphorylase [Candidatus Cyanaurora vandensis]|uniref:S-methyl-5'-thioadenosine phosphorylase n=1 Tax=Candidatus Cyanaurora vandensis TaxID=2714958 RepID=UPI00257E6BBC|nr:S-methyl-5'-thioadenosine phosphorylase [Candidatus Cyanaurora vandensis]
MHPVKIAVIGGSGLYQMSGLTDCQEIQVPTPFGEPSDTLMTGRVEGVDVVFLPRHGRHHRLLPSEVPYRANIYALKTLGVEYVISIAAVGSLQETYRPMDIVLPDQFFDWTRHRAATFFGEGLVAHVSLAHPVAPELVDLATGVCAEFDLGAARVHPAGTYLCMEGPAFSSYAESRVYRSWGMAIIGMTNATEAKLCREAEMAYCTLAFVTDYDCWHPDRAAVTVEQVIDYLNRNVTTAQHILKTLIPRLGQTLPVCAAHSALKDSLFTRPENVPAATRTKLAPLLQKYWS